MAGVYYIGKQGNKTPKRFSLSKGVFMLGVAMLMGFVLTFELMSKSQKLDAREMKKRSLADGLDIAKRSSKEDQSILDFLSSFITSTEPDVSENMTATPMFNQSEFNTTQDYNITGDHGDVSTIAMTTTEIPTTTIPVEPCFREEYKIRNVCVLPEYLESTYGENVTLEKVGHMLFLQSVLDRLQDVCEPGEWCLSDDWKLVADDYDFMDFCVIGNCLINAMPTECLDESRLLVLSTLMMLCDEAVANETDQCFLAARKMSHVTKLLSEEGKKDDCRPTFLNQNCSHSCHQYARGLDCMSEMCNQTDSLNLYSSWQWYFSNRATVTDTCDLTNNTGCDFLASVAESWFDNLLNRISSVNVTEQVNGGILAGIIIGSLVMIGGLVASVYACFRKRPDLLQRYTRERVHYREVHEDEDESDTDEEQDLFKK